jgi:hypothetical protein
MSINESPPSWVSSSSTTNGDEEGAESSLTQVAEKVPQCGYPHASSKKILQLK